MPRPSKKAAYMRTRRAQERAKRSQVMPPDKKQLREERIAAEDEGEHRETFTLKNAVSNSESESSTFLAFSAIGKTEPLSDDEDHSESVDVRADSPSLLGQSSECTEVEGPCLPFNKRRVNRRYKCEQCGKTFSTPFYMRRHADVHTRGATPRNRQRRPDPPLKEQKREWTPRTRNSAEPTCEICGKISRSTKDLERHIVSHLRGMPTHIRDVEYVCERCGKIYYSEGSLKLHERKQHGVAEPVDARKCSVCGRVCAKWAELRRHMARHEAKKHERAEKERNFLCEHCGGAFISEGHLVRHRFKKHRIAPTTKWFCKVCNLPCMNCHKLRTHEQTPTHLLRVRLQQEQNEKTRASLNRWAATAAADATKQNGGSTAIEKFYETKLQPAH